MSTVAPSPHTVRLHPAQMGFLRSDALYRCLCGGIGSGKSWAGSYDIIRRAKPGRLYLVCAPTYSMLSDSTFRSFETLAQELGILEPAAVKRSAPPSMKLRTGAEILFRSADEPDRLRGPNLSGIWLDEASLMDAAVFTVAIGRLREGGAQGFLTATFTPKGRQHWTYETFATGRPDTALFHARTADNPFLPAGFHATVRQQYTSALAAQELEGAFIDSGGTLFQRHWFQVVEAAPLRVVKRIRAWDLAATPLDAAKARDPDFTAGVLMSRSQDGTYCIEDVRRLRGSPQQVMELVRGTAHADGRNVGIVMEQEPGSAGVALIDHYSRFVLPGFNFRGERSTGSKAERAAPLAARAEAGHVRLLRGAWVKDFLDEVEMFPLGSHDDQVDAAAAAFAKLAATSIAAAPFALPGTGISLPRPF